MWTRVVLVTIGRLYSQAITNQSSVTLLHPIDPRNHCAETLESLHVPVPFFSASSVGNREKRFGVKDALF